MSYDKEIVDKLRSCYDPGQIVILNDNSGFFDEIEKNFVIGLNRIDWIKNSYEFEAKIDLKDDLNAKVNILSFFQKVKNIMGIDDEVIVQIGGDEALDKVYELPLYMLEANVLDFFSLPQHTYVVPTDFSWCVNYTFEDILYFGRSKP